MRIAVVTTSYPTQKEDPSGHFIEAEVAFLSQQGHTLQVFAPAPAGARRAVDLPAEIVALPHFGCFGWPGALTRIKRAPWRLAGALNFALKAREMLVRRGPFDRIVAHFIVPSAWPALPELSCPIEVVGHGSDVRLLQRLPRAVSRPILLELAQRGAEFRLVSEALKENLLGLCPELEPRCRVQPCRLDFGQLKSRKVARLHLGVPTKQRLVLIVGRLIPEKRVDVALRSASLLPSTRIVVVGDGPLLECFRRDFSEVEFVGRCSHDAALTWIAAADLVLSTSREEGAPSVVREARALGVDVVACAAGDLRTWARSDPRLFLVG